MSGIQNNGGKRKITFYNFYYQKYSLFNNLTLDLT